MMTPKEMRSRADALDAWHMKDGDKIPASPIMELANKWSIAAELAERLDEIIRLLRTARCVVCNEPMPLDQSGFWGPRGPYHVTCEQAFKDWLLKEREESKQ